eukprot:3973961-Lingulodinium_polyedra.AAC.1
MHGTAYPVDKVGCSDSLTAAYAKWGAAAMLVQLDRAGLDPAERDGRRCLGLAQPARVELVK